MICIGDVHGQLEKLQAILRGTGVVDASGAWCGRAEELLFIGDYVDRGQDGIGVVELVMRLQEEAQAAGGKVHALLGNHDVLLLAALFLGDLPSGGASGTFRGDWVRNGGVQADLDRLTERHIEWLASRPAMMFAGEELYQHADSLLYLEYGETVEGINEAFAAVLRGRDAGAWDRMLDQFSDRLAFFREPEQTEGYLARFGARRLIHGHTPVQYMRGEDAPAEPYVYADGRCVNLDGGMYKGGAGFSFRTMAIL